VSNGTAARCPALLFLPIYTQYNVLPVNQNDGNQTGGVNISAWPVLNYLLILTPVAVKICAVPLHAKTSFFLTKG
jgi:hypothetical protein